MQELIAALYGFRNLVNSLMGLVQVSPLDIFQINRVGSQMIILVALPLPIVCFQNKNHGETFRLYPYATHTNKLPCVFFSATIISAGEQFHRWWSWGIMSYTENQRQFRGDASRA